MCKNYKGYDNEIISGDTISVSGYANDGSGDYINGRITINKSELASGKTFDDMTPKEVIALVKSKLTFA
ncbi:hypothetical protein [Lactobacillus delbrueckii]|uniref:hypothetical protein n=1 Tax=Lactobacillus delbrueckii TaxID=1584 RepID=UPI001F2CCA6C|nr:hypothetical protein [Lactobacillus delbrueckii]GHN50778.1 hypothetical protein ME801_04470 [Lactobacillus delbrueckii]